MPLINATVSCPIFENSFRVQQIAGLFDVSLAERATESFSVKLPALDEPWQIGVIVGPSGSGKSTIARAAYGNAVYERTDWPRDRAVIDCFGEELPTKRIAALLTAVGFSSPPSWIKPYWALSNGEQFRCELARALLRAGGRKPPESSAAPAAPAPPSLVVFDEFTSVVDRTVAKIGSATVAKAVRRGTPGTNALRLAFIAVTCHYDVVPWLEPDWVLDMATGELTRRRLRRPSIQLAVVRCRRSVWKRFERHHYLSGALASGATCYAALWHGSANAPPQSEIEGARRDAETQREEGGSSLSSSPTSLRLRVSARETNNRPPITIAHCGEPVAFCATVGLYGRRGRKRITRIVVLPDYQGLGIGMQLAEHVAAYEASRGFRCNLTASHPAVIAHCQRSPRWQLIGIKRVVRPSDQSSHGGHVKSAVGRSVVSFEFVPEGVSAQRRGDAEI